MTTLTRTVTIKSHVPDGEGRGEHDWAECATCHQITEALNV